MWITHRNSFNEYNANHLKRYCIWVSHYKVLCSLITCHLCVSATLLYLWWNKYNVDCSVNHMYQWIPFFRHKLVERKFQCTITSHTRYTYRKENNVYFTYVSHCQTCRFLVILKALGNSQKAYLRLIIFCIPLNRLFQYSTSYETLLLASNKWGFP